MAREDVRDDERQSDRRTPFTSPRPARLDVPRETRRQLVRRPAYDPEMFGRFAENFARFMGTAKFLFYMTVFVILCQTCATVARAWLRRISVMSHTRLRSDPAAIRS